MESLPRLGWNVRAKGNTAPPTLPTAKQRVGLLLGFVLITGLVLGIAAISFLRIRDQLRLGVQHQLVTIGEEKRQQIEKLLTEVRIDSILFAEGDAFLAENIERWLLGHSSAAELRLAIRQRLEQVATSRQYRNIALFDSRGQTQLAIGAPNVAALAPQAVQVVRKQEARWVDLHRNADGRIEYGVIAPIMPRGGMPHGALYYAKDANETLYPLVQRWPIPTTTGETFLVRRDGQGVTFLSPLRHYAGAELTLTRPLDETALRATSGAQGHQGVYRGHDYRGEPVLAYTAPIAGASWSMIAKMDEEEADHGIRRLAWLTATVMTLGLGLLYALGVGLWRRDLQQRELAGINARLAAEARFRAITQSAQDAIVMIDDAGAILEWNPAAETIFGYRSEEVLGKNLHALLAPPQYSEAHRQGFTQFVSTGTGNAIGRTLELSALRRDGRSITVSLSLSALSIDGRWHAVGIVRDISEQKQSEAELEQHRKHLAQMVAERTMELEKLNRQLSDTVFALENVGMAIYQVDAGTGQLLNVNRYAAELLGYTPSEILALRVSDFEIPYGTPDVYSRAAEGILARGFSRFETMHRHKDGHAIPMEITVYSQPSPTGLPPRFLGFGIDITERCAVRQALERSERQLRLALDAGKIGIFDWDLATNEATCSDWHNQLWGYQAGEGIHSYDDYARRIHPDDRSRVESALRQSREARTPYGTEFRVVWPDGSEHWISEAGDYHDDNQGRPTRMYGTVFDITERKFAEAAREKALIEAENLARLRQEFLANMSHELRTPLNGVLGFAGIGLRNCQDIDKARNAFAKILHSGNHLLGVVNDILDFSKMEQGNLAIEAVPVDLCQTIGDVVEQVSEQARTKRLALDAENAPGFPQAAETDPLRLRQILGNVVSNAVKFTDSGSVKLSASLQESTLVFEIEDSGIGMANEHMDHLFQPFEQADGSFTRKYGGSGLGLAITDRLVRLMGGTIEVKSVLGEGSRFTIRLPYRPACQEPSVSDRATHPPGQEGAPTLAGIRVLLAEDDETNRIVTAEVLSHAGAKVTTVNNGFEAVERIHGDGPDFYDAILMDIQMPVMDGFEATRLILAMAPDLPIISLSAHALEEELARFQAAGMVAHVAKPFSLDVLIDTLKGYAGSRATKRGNHEG